jgi:uncharacterized protein
LTTVPMSEDLIRYDVLASEALRGIIRTVLLRVQKRGLPGEHHFYIGFGTTAPGVILSKRLKEQYPDDMTIVLQHKFWDLLIYDDRFEVKLSFNNVPERLVVPFAAIKSFYDPSVQFGFNPNLFAGIGGRAPAPASIPAESETVLDVEVTDAPKEGERAAAGEKPAPLRQEEQADSQTAAEPKTAKVVELDLFRKK